MNRVAFLFTSICLFTATCYSQPLQPQDSLSSLKDSSLTGNVKKSTPKKGVQNIFGRGLLYGTLGALSGTVASIPLSLMLKKDEKGIGKAAVGSTFFTVGGLAGVYYGVKTGLEMKNEREESQLKEQDPIYTRHVTLSCGPGFTLIHQGRKNSLHFGLVSGPWVVKPFWPEFYGIEYEAANWSHPGFSAKEGNVVLIGMYKVPVLGATWLNLTYGVSAGYAISTKRYFTIQYRPDQTSFEQRHVKKIKNPVFLLNGGLELQILDGAKISTGLDFQPMGTHWFMDKNVFFAPQLFRVHVTASFTVYSF